MVYVVSSPDTSLNNKSESSFVFSEPGSFVLIQDLLFSKGDEKVTVLDEFGFR